MTFLTPWGDTFSARTGISVSNPHPGHQFRGVQTYGTVKNTYGNFDFPDALYMHGFELN